MVPCVWQDRIQAGDLGSHLYNASLVPQVKSGALPGLYVETLYTNVLCDLVLEKLLPVAGARATERMVMIAAALLFFWAAYWFVTVSNREPSLAVCVSLLLVSHGIALRWGILNFYVATAFGLGFAALMWRPSRMRVLFAIPLIVLAGIAHLVPAMWAVSVVAYRMVFERVPFERRPWLLLPGAVCVIAAAAAVMLRFPFVWSVAPQFTTMRLGGITGTQQIWIWGAKYVALLLGLTAIWWILFMRRYDSGKLLYDPLVHLWLLNIVAFLALPTAIQPSGDGAFFSFIQHRVSFFIAILLCAILASAFAGRVLNASITALAVIFFFCLYADIKAVNQVEDRVSAMIEALPMASTVVARIVDDNSGINPLSNVAARACIGRCFDYANYEIPSARFRVRVARPNRFAAASDAMLDDVNFGRHIVTQDEAPIYSLCAKGEGFEFVRLDAGARTCFVTLPVSPGWRESLRLVFSR